MRLSEPQWKVLRFYLDPAEIPRVRASWFDDAGRSLGPVVYPFAYHPDAFAVQVRRLADDDSDTFRGDALGRTHLRVADLRAMEPCWAVPLYRLSPLGRELALASWQPEPRADVGRSFKVPWAMDRQMKRQADSEGRSVSALILQAVAEYLERRG